MNLIRQRMDFTEPRFNDKLNVTFRAGRKWIDKLRIGDEFVIADEKQVVYGRGKCLGTVLLLPHMVPDALLSLSCDDAWIRDKVLEGIDVVVIFFCILENRRASTVQSG